VQLDPIKPTLKAHGTKRLKLKLDILLSNFAFKFNLRRHTMEVAMEEATEQATAEATMAAAAAAAATAAASAAATATAAAAAVAAAVVAEEAAAVEAAEVEAGTGATAAAGAFAIKSRKARTDWSMERLSFCGRSLDGRNVFLEGDRVATPTKTLRRATRGRCTIQASQSQIQTDTTKNVQYLYR